MKDNGRTEIQDINKDELIDCLTEELPGLRAKIGLSQDDLSEIIGISRQTYSSIETKLIVRKFDGEQSHLFRSETKYGGFEQMQGLEAHIR